MNFLEQLAYEWYEYQGYFVRRNALVGKRLAGGFECELDIVAFHPRTGHIIHIEASMDAQSWVEREKRFKKKFESGRKYIPFMIPGYKVGMPIEQVAVFGLLKKSTRRDIAGGMVRTVADLLEEIVKELKVRRVASEAVPEQFPLLRSIQFVCEHSVRLFPVSTKSFP